MSWESRVLHPNIAIASIPIGYIHLGKSVSPMRTTPQARRNHGSPIPPRFNCPFPGGPCPFRTDAPPIRPAREQREKRGVVARDRDRGCLFGEPEQRPV